MGMLGHFILTWVYQPCGLKACPKWKHLVTKLVAYLGIYCPWNKQSVLYQTRSWIYDDMICVTLWRIYGWISHSNLHLQYKIFSTGGFLIIFWYVFGVQWWSPLGHYRWLDPRCMWETRCGLPSATSLGEFDATIAGADGEKEKQRPLPRGHGDKQLGYVGVVQNWDLV